ncbi:MAG: VOC family protein [Acidobacteria bacterium]|nr:VOC family protein [Acidobacteriota bacterium]
MRSLRIDHVAIAGSELSPIQRGFEAAGLSVHYGGAHANGVTHMAMCVCDDGSYVELIAPLVPGQRAPVWPEQIARDGGPCGWAVRTDDLAGEAARVAGLGVPVVGPHHNARRRADGVVAEWEVASFGGGQPGALLPFAIQDDGAREYRVPGVSPDAAGIAICGLLTGVSLVVLGVTDLDAAAALFRRVYDWPALDVHDDDLFGARIAQFSGTPVVLAAPRSADGWLAARNDRFGDSPCAYVLGTVDLESASRHLSLTSPTRWLNRRVAWMDHHVLDARQKLDARLGVTVAI